MFGEPALWHTSIFESTIFQFTLSLLVSTRSDKGYAQYPFPFCALIESALTGTISLKLNVVVRYARPPHGVLCGFWFEFEPPTAYGAPEKVNVPSPQMHVLGVAPAIEPYEHVQESMPVLPTAEVAY